MPRERLPESMQRSYFAQPANIELFSSGAVLLDCVLGGGWAQGRVSNVVGDRSSGKTLLAIEGMANFHRLYAGGKIRYNEVEAAFDTGYAAQIGMPIDAVEFSEPCYTVEDVFNDLNKWLLALPNSEPGLYILDSLDAVSDKDELEGEFGKDSYGARKPKLLGQLFRRVVQLLEQKRVHVMIISQVRDNIGVTFGEKHTRSGGKALDFYASQILWLASMGKLKKTRGGVERTVGVKIRAQCKKNKIALPFRECEFPIIFGYGIDDVTACVEWLQKVKRLDTVSLTDAAAERLLKGLDKLSDADFASTRETVASAVKNSWYEIEEQFLPTRRKYAE